MSKIETLAEQIRETDGSVPPKSKCPEHAGVAGVPVVILIETEDVELLAVAVILPARIPTDLRRNADRDPRKR